MEGFHSHYLGWIFPLSGLGISAPCPPTGCSLFPLQGAPCPPYRVLPVPPTDWVVKRDFKSFWAKLSPLQGAPCPPYRMLPVPPTGRSLSPLQIGWLRGILNHFEPRLFPYSCPDCSPTGCYLGWIFPLSGRDIFDFWAGYWHLTPVVRTFDRLCQNFWQTLSKHKDLLEISKNYVLALPLLGSGFIDKLFHNLS